MCYFVKFLEAYEDALFCRIMQGEAIRGVQVGWLRCSRHFVVFTPSHAPWKTSESLERGHGVHVFPHDDRSFHPADQHYIPSPISRPDGPIVAAHQPPGLRWRRNGTYRKFEKWDTLVKLGQVFSPKKPNKKKHLRKGPQIHPGKTT